MAGERRTEAQVPDQAGMSEQAGRVLDALRAGGPELPIVILARITRQPPTALATILDELYEAGYVEPGAERRSIRAVPVDSGGRFARRARVAGEPLPAREGDG